jgi:hypothetical protein
MNIIRQTNTWTTKAPFPGTPRRSEVCFSIGNKGYIGTGARSDDVLLKDFWEYDAVTNICFKNRFSRNCKRSCLAFSIGTKGYVGMGYDGNLKSDFWEYDPAEIHGYKKQILEEVSEQLRGIFDRR